MRRLTLALLVLPFLSGCVTLFSKTEIVREGETRRAIQFECPQAADAFSEAVKNRSACVGGTHVGGPFLTLYSKHKMLSDGAHFNACVARCDSDQDGVITFTEAAIFAKSKD
jgi:hypothetical protein